MQERQKLIEAIHTRIEPMTSVQRTLSRFFSVFWRQTEVGFLFWQEGRHLEGVVKFVSPPRPMPSSSDQHPRPLPCCGRGLPLFVRQSRDIFAICSLKDTDFDVGFCTRNGAEMG